MSDPKYDSIRSTLRDLAVEEEPIKEREFQEFQEIRRVGPIRYIWGITLAWLLWAAIGALSRHPGETFWHAFSGRMWIVFAIIPVGYFLRWRSLSRRGAGLTNRKASALFKSDHDAK